MSGRRWPGCWNETEPGWGLLEGEEMVGTARGGLSGHREVDWRLGCWLRLAGHSVHGRRRGRLPAGQGVLRVQGLGRPQLTTRCSGRRGPGSFSECCGASESSTPLNRLRRATALYRWAASHTTLGKNNAVIHQLDLQHIEPMVRSKRRWLQARISQLH
jgi:hypothetical protein